MALKFEELKILRNAEAIADDLWRDVIRWKPFALEVVGGQFARAADSIGANIAEAFGRFHYREKLQFLYYARGSLYETMYWLNRALERELLPAAQGQKDQRYASDLTELARQLNAFLSSLKTLRRDSKAGIKNVSEARVEYISDSIDSEPLLLFTTEELEWLEAVQIR